MCKAQVKSCLSNSPFIPSFYSQNKSSLLPESTKIFIGWEPQHASHKDQDAKGEKKRNGNGLQTGDEKNSPRDLLLHCWLACKEAYSAATSKGSQVMSSPAAPDSSPPSSSGAPGCPGATKPSLFCRYHATSLPGSSSTSPTKKPHTGLQGTCTTSVLHKYASAQLT